MRSIRFRNTNARMFIAVVVLFQTFSLLHAVDAKPRSVLDYTMEQRDRSDPRNRPFGEPTLVLPWSGIGAMAQPLETGNGKRFPYAQPFLHFIWHRQAMTAKGREYLSMRKKFPDPMKKMELIRWCDKNGLPACAAYEGALATRAYTIRNLGPRGTVPWKSAFYKSHHAYWLKFMDTQQSMYTYPLPVTGEWYVVIDKTKHHRIKAGAAYAFDLVKRRSGRYFKGRGTKNEEYYAWNQPVVAQADGLVVRATNRNPDNRPRIGGQFNASNTVIVKYSAGIMGLYAHLLRGSVAVAPGDKVRAGQELGRVGNSGASGIPHLHFCLIMPGGDAIKGRYAFEVKRGARWVLVNGEDLPEGADVRSVPLETLRDTTPQGHVTDPDDKQPAAGKPKPRPRPRPPIERRDDPAKLLTLAHNYIEAGLHDIARQKLELLLKQFPNSDEAAEARALLKTLEGK